MSAFEQMMVSNAAGTAINPARKEDMDALPGGMADALILLAALVSLLLFLGPLRGRRLRWHRKQS